MEEYEPNPTVPPPAHPPEGWSRPDVVTESAVAEADLSDGAGPASPATGLRLRVELAVMLFVAAVPGLVIGLEGITDPEVIDIDVGVIELVATLLAALGPAAVATYLLWRDGRLSAAGFDRRPWRWVLGYGALGAVCAVIAMVGALIVVSILLAASGAEPPEPDSTDVALTVGSALAGLLIATTAGVAEEIVYRAYAITRLEELGWMRTAIWAPWAVFTLQHLYQGPFALVVIGAVGASFVWLYRWQRSLWPVVVAHALYDVFVLALLVSFG